MSPKVLFSKKIAWFETQLAPGRRKLCHHTARMRRFVQALWPRSLVSVAPSCPEADASSVEELIAMVKKSQPSGGVLVVTGAGISTESGIPDYRSPGRPLYKPMTHQTFLQDDKSRRRYWARSMRGFSRLANAEPNGAHIALALLEKGGFIKHIITQNVDRLHQKAGSKHVLELHGTIHEAECMSCGAKEDRTHLQGRLEEWNQEWKRLVEQRETAAGITRPDGDVDLCEGLDYTLFNIPPCLACGKGPLKPAVVFHGGSLLQRTRDEASMLARHADSALVLGSTLTVFSSFRLVQEVAKRGRPVAIVNLGPTRADSLVAPMLRISSSTSSVMGTLASAVHLK